MILFKFSYFQGDSPYNSMKQFNLSLLLCYLLNYSFAQSFIVDPPGKKKPDEFALNLVTILNDAPVKFSHIKGKLLAQTDTIHLQSQIYQVKTFIPGSVIGRIVLDSTIYTEYFFGEFENAEEAKIQMELLSSKMSKALNRRVVILKKDNGADANTVLEHKFAYTFHNGFFHYNFSLQVNKVLTRDTYRIVFQVFSGKPSYYNWIMKNEPIGSFNFTKAIKNNIEIIDKLPSKSGCPVEVPPFTCVGISARNDTSFIEYNKKGFDGLVNAKSEFDAFFGSIRSGLSTEYVYFNQNAKIPVYRKVAFVKFDDIDKPKRKTVYLTLQEKSQGSQLPNGKKEYEVILSFGY